MRVQEPDHARGRGRPVGEPIHFGPAYWQLRQPPDSTRAWAAIGAAAAALLAFFTLAFLAMLLIGPE